MPAPDVLVPWLVAVDSKLQSPKPEVYGSDSMEQAHIAITKPGSRKQHNTWLVHQIIVHKPPLKLVDWLQPVVKDMGYASC